MSILSCIKLPIWLSTSNVNSGLVNRYDRISTSAMMVITRPKITVRRPPCEDLLRYIGCVSWLAYTSTNFGKCIELPKLTYQLLQRPYIPWAGDPACRAAHCPTCCSNEAQGQSNPRCGSLEQRSPGLSLVGSY